MSPLAYMGTPDATSKTKGKVRFATAAEAAAGTSTKLVITPAELATSKYAPIIGSSAGPQILTGTAAPATAVTAPKGSIYIRTGAGATSASTRLYVNTDGATAWTAITTAT